MKKIFYTIGCAAVIFSGCEKAVDIDVPFEDPKLVLNGFMNPDSSFSVHLSKSQFVLDEAELQNIPDARVWVYEGSRQLGEMVHLENGVYKLPGIRPEAGKTYTIQAEKAGFSSVKASEGVLHRSNISSFNSDTIRMEEYNGTEMGYEFTLEDPAGENNYYLLKVMESGIRKEYKWVENGEEPEWEWKHYYQDLYAESADPLVEDYCVNYTGCGLLLTDDFIDGKAHRIKMTATIYNNYYDPEYIKDVTVVMAVYQIPESYYRYLKTLEENENVRDNPFAEPAKVYSNVEGGYGIWSSITPGIIEVNK